MSYKAFNGLERAKGIEQNPPGTAKDLNIGS